MAEEHNHARLPSFTRYLFPPFSGLVIGAMLTNSLRSLARRRPQLFDRLGEFRASRYLIDAVDLPFVFEVVPNGDRSSVRVMKRGEPSVSDVVIKGPILMLLSILDGTLDGDALFFHRVISVSGRTEAVLALRNTIEDAELRPADLLGLRGSLGSLADKGILGGLNFARQLADHMSGHKTREAK